MGSRVRVFSLGDRDGAAEAPFLLQPGPMSGTGRAALPKWCSRVRAQNAPMPSYTLILYFLLFVIYFLGIVSFWPFTVFADALGRKRVLASPAPAIVLTARLCIAYGAVAYGRP